MQPKEQATRPEFTKEDFVHRGKNGGYLYPFTSDEDFTEVTADPWDDCFDESLRGPDGIYTKPGFDLQQTITEMGAPVIEVAGPSDKGFAILHDIELPSRPIITNLVGNRKAKTDDEYNEGLNSGDDNEFWWGAKSMTSLDRLALDGLIDITHFPARDNSVGVLLASCIPNAHPKEIYERFKARGITSENKKRAKHLSDKISREDYHKPMEAIITGELEVADEHQKSPRLATIIEAARVLRPGGVLIENGVRPQDVKAAKALGFEMVMHTPPRIASYIDGKKRLTIREVVFQKPVEPAK